jgi:hypothetical protein
LVIITVIIPVIILIITLVIILVIILLIIIILIIIIILFHSSLLVVRLGCGCGFMPVRITLFGNRLVCARQNYPFR